MSLDKGGLAPFFPDNPFTILPDAVDASWRVVQNAATQTLASQMKILIIEDKYRLGHLLLKGIREMGATAVWKQSCSDANDALAESSFDAVILDLSLPDGDGLDLLRAWRKSGFNEPVLILSARDAVLDRIKGLDEGADDYLAKPFSMGELVARMRSLLRRQGASKESILTHGKLKMNLIDRSFYRDGCAVELTLREFSLLEIFMRNPGRTLPRTFICEKIWESNFDVDANLLDVYMSRLRAKLETGDDSPLFKTVRGVGYQLL